MPFYPGRVRLFHFGVWSMRWDSLLTLCELLGHELELRQSWHSCCPSASLGTLTKAQLRSQGGRGLGQVSLPLEGGAPPRSPTPPPASTHHPQPPSWHQQTLEVSKISATPPHLISATLPHHLHLSASIHPYLFPKLRLPAPPRSHLLGCQGCSPFCTNLLLAWGSNFPLQACSFPPGPFNLTDQFLSPSNLQVFFHQARRYLSSPLG